jgi:hypothetical protein
MFVGFHMQKSLILSMIEWADSFGANTLTLSDRLSGLEDGMQDAIDSYLEQDYDATITFLQSISQAVKEISSDVIKLKDEALTWVYLVEWLAVSGTSMVCGFVLWSLMIKRRAFRRVDTTRFM